MNTQTRRYVFIDFEDLKKVKFKKLEKVCDKLFILITTEERYIPFELVQQMQKIGKGVKWILVDDQIEKNVNYHICFLMGRLHQKVNSDIEFAILSNDKAFDPIVNFINNCGRSCLRVKRKKNKQEREKVEVTTPATYVDSEGNIEEPEFLNDQPAHHIIEGRFDDQLIKETAQETVNRLVRSGNRPSDVLMLKNYILLHNQELTTNGGIDKIIKQLEVSNEIEIKEGEVIYNF